MNELLLIEKLNISISVNEAYENLIGLLHKACQKAINVKGRQFLAGMLVDYFWLDDFLDSLNLCMLGAAGDSKIIEMCQIFLDVAGIQKSECFIDSTGVINRRKVYFAQKSDGKIKIGSSINVEERLSQLKTGAGENLVLLYQIDGSTVREKLIHEILKDARVHGEWFSPGPVLEFIAKSKSIKDGGILSESENSISLIH
ncbi:GIY-YIG nuclease family protein [Undibacterium sp. Ji50W]|uniref:GIY-YIG nuclease family protein n=1 Tax=Undibacterium sp. Ji50W TaxID=3413041 RepID=UPI003BEF64DD